ncbi:MAG: hypothetical protein JWP97_4552 [Labilithrix sp.]|nr:hypothetical protein [Labilithrix sp.]
MPLTEESFTALVDAGCPRCAGVDLTLEALVLQKLPLLEGELYGSPSWGYKGEELVMGSHLITCNACEHELYRATDCHRCGAADGVTRALETASAVPLPTRCTGCGSPLVTAFAFVPATVHYEGKRAQKARTQTSPEDEGFHFVRAECKQCKQVAEVRQPCPLCGGA